MERTLILVKPDAFARNLTGEIIARFERKGLRLVALNLMTMSRELAERHYAEHVGPPPPTTAHGALLAHITAGHIETAAGARSYQPMNVNFGLFPPLAHPLRGDHGQQLRGSEKGLAKKRAVTRRALADLARWISGDDRAVAAE